MTGQAAQLAEVERLARERPGLRLLLLVGSRARADASERSDWDLAYLGDPTLDPWALLADLSRVLGTDRVDLADLDRANGVFRYRAAKDGVCILEGERGLYDRFWFEAVSFWCDAEPVLKPERESLLSRLGA